MSGQAHWQDVYTRKAATEVSWYQPEATTSLALIERAGLRPDAAILDVGGGASTLVDGLLARGFHAITVIDLAGAALDASRQRLGERARGVTWLEGDITRADLPAAAFDLWHDRAVFHFLTSPEARAAWHQQLMAALKPGGYVVLATFADDGPEKCSGLPVRRYSEAGLQAELGDGFELIESRREVHRTPAGNEQRFVYGLFRRKA